MRLPPFWFLLLVLTPATAGSSAAATPSVFQAEDARINPARAEIVGQAAFQGQKGVALKAGVEPAVEADNSNADLVFTIRAPQAGRYALMTHAAVDEAGKALMHAATSKFASLAALIQIDDRHPSSRVIFVPWSPPDSCSQYLGIFDLTGERQEVRFWLPAGVKLDRLEIRPFHPPAVPAQAAAYVPKYLPPPGHPRLWVNSNTLARVRANLNHPENRPEWERVKARAAKPFVFKPDSKREVTCNTALENAAAAKAFVYLAQGDRQAGREAVKLMLAYLPRVEYGNLLDITREIGAAIYTGARVYDWGYDLCTPKERQTLRRHMLRLAEEMECGWPPFRMSIVNGHGNEAMINRDLLSMAIAVYDEDPKPYQYCAWLELEQLVPMRRFEYQSPRHNQGVSYAAFRFGWEMHAAWLLRNLAGREVFDPNIKTVPTYWLYMRLPNGEMLRDGDGVPAGNPWSYAQTAWLCCAYSGNALFKGEFERQGGRVVDPLLYLLLNDPNLKADPSLDSLPLTIDFGPVLGGMIARTGWHLGTNADDVVAEIKGGGYHFGNHQHADAGAIQLYYRGLQIADLGQYKFYGTPFDLNFNKRSIAHSMMLVFDPQESFPGAQANDGGARFLQGHPRAPEEAQNNPRFHYGEVLSCSFGPSTAHPAFSYFSADLKSAYSEKIAGFTRSLCILNLNNATNPAALVILDDISSAKPEFKKYWQLNTLNPPRITAGGIELHNSADGATGRVDVCMLWPKPYELDIKSGAEVHNVFGQTFTPPAPSAPEARGHRVLFSPKQAQTHDRFLVVLQAYADTAAPLPCVTTETEATVAVRLGHRIVSLAKGTTMTCAPFDLTVPADGKQYQIWLAGLQAGRWNVTPASGGPAQSATVEPGKNTIFFASHGGSYHIAPMR